MTDWYILPGVLLAGLILGGVFFGGLWLTVKLGLVSKQPALWFSISLILRLGITLAGFYLIAGTHWERFVVMLAGFIISRILVKRITRNDAVNQIKSEP